MSDSVSFSQLLISLAAGIGFIVLLTARYKIHAVFTLFLACFIVGLGVEMGPVEILGAMKEGFGHIMKALALLIVVGTALGVLLEKIGSTGVMADYILGLTGEKRASVALSTTGFVVGLPIFCDSGYIVLSGLAKSLSVRTGRSLAVLAFALATGLYSVHCLIPPHPGMSAATAQLGLDFGKVILYGTLLAVPASTVGWWWVSRSFGTDPDPAGDSSGQEEEVSALPKQRPGVVMAFLPVIVPILLIAIKPFWTMFSSEPGIVTEIINVLGEPVIALAAGIVLAVVSIPGSRLEVVRAVLSDSAEKAGGILVIIGAGGAFGGVLAATHPAEHFAAIPAVASLGLLFPFLVTFVLKTAQGSSTVAIITAASLIAPMLEVLGLDSESGRLLTVLSMGAGSMMISHANDAYFWVIARFSGIPMNQMLRGYTVASILMGLTSLGVLLLASWVLRG